MGWLTFFKSKKELSRIKSDQAYQMIKQKKAILIDVRTTEEYRERRIPQAILIPVYEVATHFEKRFPQKELNYILYCRSGIRSNHAQEILRSLGYQHVYDLGGIIDWPYETESGNQRDK